MKDNFKQGRARKVDSNKFKLYRQYFTDGNKYLDDFNSHDEICYFFDNIKASESTPEQRYTLHILLSKLSERDFNRIQSWMKTKKHREKKAELGLKPVSITIAPQRFAELKRIKNKLGCKTYNELVKELARRYNVTEKQMRKRTR